ncbi:hypothetical protein [Microbacterium invictum]|uniref:Uncharacterized protein n=1 Tax=Microbacterium invictum TaxID=515415 RepID=A0ABZ0VCX6_9MICO|nr:hypothetical protein [Microbacterium invictum]WQB71339.1 hypothetical protein T9R20_05060 [Microbacterium invictum]
MDWWMALLVAGVPSLVTAVSLIVQQRINANTAAAADESRRIDAEAERQHEERMLEASNAHARQHAEADRQNAARESWRADRRAAHTKLLTRFEEIQSAARAGLGQVSTEIDLVGEMSEWDSDLPDLPQELVADVALLCSDRSAGAAQQASARAAALAISVMMLELLGPDRELEQLKADRDTAKSDLDRFTKAVAEYRQAAKQDIDTVN